MSFFKDLNIYIKNYIEGKEKLITIWYYISGYYRDWLYYNKPNVLRIHIKEQIDFRIDVMNLSCLEEGSCVKCGCSCTELQCAYKSCDGNCYPPFFNKACWKYLKYTGMKQVMESYYKSRNKKYNK